MVNSHCAGLSGRPASALEWLVSAVRDLGENHFERKPDLGSNAKASRSRFDKPPFDGEIAD
jgi:hypothetical protein